MTFLLDDDTHSDDFNVVRSSMLSPGQTDYSVDIIEWPIQTGKVL